MTPRTISLIKLVMFAAGIVASLITQVSFAATDHVNVQVFVADYDRESTLYTGAIYLDGTWRAIGFENESLDRHEDDVQTDNQGMMTVDLFTDGSLHFNHNNKTFNFWYLNDNSVTLPQVNKVYMPLVMR